MNYTKIVALIGFVSFVFLSGSLTAHGAGLLQPRGEDSAVSANQKMTTDEVRKLVREEFGKDHPMIDVARCESSFRQYEEHDEVLRNPESDAIGIFQILENLHEQPADELGYDIFTAEGNIDYARKLYDSFGLAPWSPSSLCWDDGSIEEANATENASVNESTKVPVRVRGDGELVRADGEGSSYVSADAENESSTGEKESPQKVPEVISKKLVSGVSDPEVKRLQELLNNLGYRLSSSGPGSPGKETEFFGAKTRTAVKKFQCDKNIVCSGGRYTTGYGLVDAETREVLNEEAAQLRPGEYRLGGVRVRGDMDSTDQSNKNSSDDNEGVDEDKRTDASSNAQLKKQINQAQRLIVELQTALEN